MEYSEVIQKRFSIRKFSEKKVEEEKVKALLEAGRIAPTAGNRQPQRILVLQSEEALKKVNECTPCGYGASLMLIVCYDPEAENTNFVGDNMGFGMVDASIVMTHIMLKATDLGLGTTWVGLFKPELLREKFNIPKRYQIVSLMPIGYAAPEVEVSKSHNDRFALDHTYTAETYL